jgi:hypothetical protein
MFTTSREKRITALLTRRRGKIAPEKNRGCSRCMVWWRRSLLCAPQSSVTLFTFFFLAGFIMAGSANILTLLLAARWLYLPLDRFITRGRVDFMAKVILLTGTIVGYAYAMEWFVAYYGANKFELYTFLEARLGLHGMSWYSCTYYVMISGSVLAPQLFWLKRMRTHYVVVFIICLLVNLSVWFERFVVFVTSVAAGTAGG